MGRMGAGGRHGRGGRGAGGLDGGLVAQHIRVGQGVERGGVVGVVGDELVVICRAALGAGGRAADVAGVAAGEVDVDVIARVGDSGYGDGGAGGGAGLDVAVEDAEIGRLVGRVAVGIERGPRLGRSPGGGGRADGAGVLGEREGRQAGADAVLGGGVVPVGHGEEAGGIGRGERADEGGVAELSAAGADEVQAEGAVRQGGVHDVKQALAIRNAGRGASGGVGDRDGVNAVGRGLHVGELEGG